MNQPKELWTGYWFDGHFLYDKDGNKVSKEDVDNVWIQRQLFHLQITTPDKLRSMKTHLEDMIEQLQQPIKVDFSYKGESIRSIELVPYPHKHIAIREKQHK